MGTKVSDFFNLPVPVVCRKVMKLTTHHRLGARLGMVVTILPRPYVSIWRADGQFLLFFLAEINMIWILLSHAVQKIRLINIILFYTRVTEDSTVTWFLSYLLTYLLILSMEQNPSWEANRFSTSQEIPLILWNPNVHYRVYKSPPPVSSLSQINSPCPLFPLPEDPSLYYNLIYAWVSQVVSFPQVSPPRSCTYSSSPSYMLHDLPISFFTIWSLE